jgi:hypothetical protein
MTPIRRSTARGNRRWPEPARSDELGTSHHERLRACAPASTLDPIDEALDRREHRTHEFGDSIFLERQVSRPTG